MIFFQGTSTDFFGPNATDFEDFYCNVPIKHLVPDCGERVVRGINTLAKKIAEAKTWPEWQRPNGSIDYENLHFPWDVKKDLEKSDFDERGYIALHKIHVYSVEAMEEQSAVQVGSRGMFAYNHCSLPGCHREVKPQMKSLSICPALSVRLAEGPGFDIRDHKKLFQRVVPVLRLQGWSKATGHYNDAYLKIETILKYSKGFESFWNYADGLKPKPYTYFDFITQFFASFFSAAKAA